MAGLTQTVAPTSGETPDGEPVTRQEFKDHVLIGGDDADAWIDEAIEGARELFELESWRQLVTATFELKLDGFPYGGFVLPRPPYASLTSIYYLNTSGVSTLLASSVYDVDDASGNEEAFVALAPGQSWPSTESGKVNAVTVTYVAGYGAASAVPSAIKKAIKQLAAHWYENRESTVVVQGIVQSQVKQTWDLIVQRYGVRSPELAGAV
jgi:uncharacterized phiE125 gp8 family phage protein